MEKRTLGSTGVDVSVLGFGGAEIGFQSISDDVVTNLLSTAFATGLNVIDTAECYAKSEELIGQSVSNRRQDYFLFTKVGHSGPFGSDNWTKDGILKSIDRSLKRLQTDYLDLVQLHSCSKKTLKKGDCIEALIEAQSAGKTRFIGYSGDGQDALCAVETGAFDTLQTSINIADQEAIDLTIPRARERNMGVIAKRPLANVAWRFGQRPPDSYSKPYWERLRQLKYDFIDGDLSTAVSMALRFTLSVPGVHTAIVGTTKTGHWKENDTELSNGLLSKDQFESIRARWKEVAAADWVGQV